MNVTENANKNAERRSRYGRAQSGFGKPHVALMSDVRPPTGDDSTPPVAALLGTIPSLRFVTPAGLHALADATRLQSVDHGEMIIRQRAHSDDVFFILDGTFDVLISHFGETPDYIRTLRAGDSFGELGVLYDVPRTASVRCAEAGQVLRIPGQAFLEALETAT